MSGNENVNQIWVMQNELPKKNQEFLEKYLSNAPKWVLECMQVVHKEKDTVFIEENTPVNQIFILADGTAKAIDYRIQGCVYAYMQHTAVRIFGSMEVMLNMPLYRTTLMTATPCTMLVLSRSNFEKWLWEDKNALRIEVELMGRNLLEQDRKNRVFLFLQGKDRLLYHFSLLYEETMPKEKYVISLTRQELAERTGFSIKTVNRAVKQMEAEGYIGRDGWKIIITRRQYGMIKEYLETLLEQT